MQRFIFQEADDETRQIELMHVVEVTGLNGMPVNINSTKAYEQDGVTVSSLTMDARPFSIKFDILGEDFKAAAAERRALTAFFGNKKPKKFIYLRDDFRLYLKDVYPAGIYETGVNEKRILNGTMQFLAANPYFRKDISMPSYSFETPLLEYREEGLEYPGEGIEYSITQPILSVTNEGDDVSPALIRFYGPANNPIITNHTTKQTMTVSKVLGNKDILEITTETGRVEIIDEEGERYNAFNYLQNGSKFIELAVGVNEIEFGSTEGSTGCLEVCGVEYYAGI